MSSDVSSSGPRVTVLTPEGRGAIGVIRVWGTGAVDAADAAFRPARGKELAQTPRGRLRLGRIGRGLGDEVVAVVLELDPPAVEIQCHGGPAAQGMVLEALQAVGAGTAPADQWAEQAMPTRIRAQALVDLGRASTLRTAEILLDQAWGALDRELAGLAARILEDQEAGLKRLDRLIRHGQVGLRLVTGWRVVIAGRPNVGKSRLLNALAGYSRAIVDPAPGTTRDLVSVSTAMDGWPLELVDTAGVREADDAIERSGIERALHQQATASLVLKVLDRSEPLRDFDRALVSASNPALLVANKADLPPAWQPAELPSGAVPIVVSAERGVGLEELSTAIAEALVPAPPEPGAGVPFRSNHVERLEKAREALRAGDAESAIREIEALCL
ncbi:MAG: GTPase [Isosphaeraceae bacterium]